MSLDSNLVLLDLKQVVLSRLTGRVDMIALLVLLGFDTQQTDLTRCQLVCHVRPLILTSFQVSHLLGGGMVVLIKQLGLADGRLLLD